MNEQNVQKISQIVMFHSPTYFEEIDFNFLLKLKAIKQKKKSQSKGFFEQNRISQAQCQKISSYAELHSRANKVNTTSMFTYEKIRNTPDSQYCSCGCQKAAGQSISILTNEQNFTFLGPGVILFFFLLKTLRMLVLLVIFSYGIFSIASNLLSPSNIEYDQCPNKDSDIDRFVCQLNSITTYNLKQSLWLRQIQLWLGLFALIFWILGLNFIEYLGVKKNKQIDDLLDSASDYTIKIDGLPDGKINEKQLRDFIMQLWVTRQNLSQDNFQEVCRNDHNLNETPLKLKSIQIIYDMSKCRNMISKIQDLSVVLFEMIQQNNKIPSQISDQYKINKKQLIFRLEQLRNLQVNFKQDVQLRRSLSTSCALIYFDLAEQQKQFLDCYNSLKSSTRICNEEAKIQYKGNKILITRAPQPSDFSWQNCQKKFSYLRFTFIWIITLALLYAASAFVSYIQSLQEVKTRAALAASILVQLFNRIIWFTLSFLVTFQYHNTKTNFIKSLMSKSLIAQSINVVFAPMIMNIMYNKALFGENSISSNSLYYQFIMFFMMFVFYVANPIFYLKLICINVKCLRNIVIRKMSVVIGQIDTIEQIKPILKLYEGPEFPIAGAYVYMSTALIHTFFYCHLQPLLLIIFLANMLGFYVIMKYLLFQRCRIPEITEFDIFKMAISSFKSAALFYSVGSIVFIVMDHLQNQAQLEVLELIPSSLCLTFCVLVNINPFGIAEKINNIVFKGYQFCRHFQKSDNPQIKINNIFASVITKTLANLKVVYERKQSYYQFSNLQKLFNYQKELIQITDIQNLRRIHQLETFCQSFIDRSKSTYKLNVINKNNRYKMALKDLILIPVIKNTEENNQLLQPKRGHQFDFLVLDSITNFS